MKVGIINYGMGNIGSVARALSLLDADPVVLEEPDEFDRVDRVILPGVGAFSAAMANLHDRGWVEAIDRNVKRGGQPFLGICLGMQLLADESEENGVTAGLGLVPGRVVSLSKKNIRERIPHVGWNEVSPVNDKSLLAEIPPGTDFYFVHSYVFDPADDGDIAAVTNYGARFVAAVERGNVSGAQFHPERSADTGARLLRNFLAWQPAWA